MRWCVILERNISKSYISLLSYISIPTDYAFGRTKVCVEELQDKFSRVQEPMYIILNTAISHRWGMPEPCDHEHCSACWICYDCMNPGTVLYFLWTAILVHSFKVNDPYLYEDTSFGSLNAYMIVLCALECQCTLPDTLKNCASLPATMKIDYIRLYQDKSDPQHSLGCDTEQVPTATFIREHAGI